MSANMSINLQALQILETVLKKYEAGAEPQSKELLQSVQSLITVRSHEVMKNLSTAAEPVFEALALLRILDALPSTPEMDNVNGRTADLLMAGLDQFLRVAEFIKQSNANDDDDEDSEEVDLGIN